MVRKTLSVKKTAGRGRPSRSEDQPNYKEVILDGAEGLFAQHGFYGVSTRQVAVEAGIDVALVHYYFGTKRGLFDAVFLRRAEILNAARLASLDAYERDNAGALTAEGAIAAFVHPLIDASLTGGPGWKSYFALVAQVNNTPAWGGATMTRFFDPVVHRLIDVLSLALPDAQENELYWGYQFLTGAMTLCLSETGRIDLLSNGACHSNDLEAIRNRLTGYCAAGFRALVESQRPTAAVSPT
ncbi:TetR/AcrR family transcriptional regulator [Phenylobacterium sp.]|jgi:AcrR family transcriptional regulator|uniref:TetR/AcrR family transcriptional regulator n=1 Tax=Phenylobacterium sp. TaxID=1871053 RepID=UPI002E334F88|nr:TetR/AcrR family transcriptional regulator [Phenylobacterium sp.]HEX4710535.1 TetR/AcrR family transcriptional regulator [Phenylobacterium sp.]